MNVKQKKTDPNLSVELSESAADSDRITDSSNGKESGQKSGYYDNHLRLVEGVSGVGAIALSEDAQPSMTVASQVVLPYLPQALNVLRDELRPYYDEEEIDELLDKFESFTKGESNPRNDWLICPECDSETCIINGHDDGMGYTDYEFVCDNGHYVFMIDTDWIQCPECGSRNISTQGSTFGCEDCGEYPY